MTLRKGAGMLFAAMCLCGCAARYAETGTDGREYTRMVQQRFNRNLDAERQRRKLKLPLRLAVAMIGELAAPEVVLNRLRAQPVVCAQVCSIPAMYPAGEESASIGRVAAADRLKVLRETARQVEADYLVLLTDRTRLIEQPCWQSVFELTGIGAYVLPSRRVSGTVQAVAALISTADGAVLYVGDAQAQDERIVTAMSRSGRRSLLVQRLVNQALIELTDRMLETVVNAGGNT